MKLKQKRQIGLFLSAFLIVTMAQAEDPAPAGRPQIVINPGAAGNPASAATQILSSPATPPGSTAPTTTAPGATPSIPVPLQNSISYGRFRNKDGTTKVADMMLDRYQESVVRITVKDHAGNPLSQAMGVSVGREQTFIATSLSLLLGNAIQWADEIELEHHAGNKYGATIALIDEQVDLALLIPENMPSPIPLVRRDDERSGINIFTFGLNAPVVQPGQQNVPNLEPKIYKGSLAAANSSAGTLSVSKDLTDNSHAGTGIINMQGELVGMLLANGRGVLASRIAEDITKAINSKPLPVRMLGAIMGRGILVDPQLPEAYKSIEEALAAVKKGEAPKANPKLFIAEKTRELAPKETGRVILKVMPGIYKQKDTISIPKDISLTGSGPKDTILIGQNPNQPVIKIENAQRVSVTGFRIIPAPLQDPEAATVLINKADGAVLLGNLIEGKGGTAVQILNSREVGIFGNAFPRGKARAVNCKASQTIVEANSFLGDWPQALSVDKDCDLQATRNLFLETQLGVALSSQALNASITRNTFMRSVAGVRFFGIPLQAVVSDNVFDGGVYSIFSSIEFDAKKIGRNHAWKNLAMAKGKQLTSLDIVKIEPAFENPDIYDYRPKVRSPIAGSGKESTDLGKSDLGAYQRTDFLGPHTSYFIRSLEAATGSQDLARRWGFDR